MIRVGAICILQLVDVYRDPLAAAAFSTARVRPVRSSGFDIAQLIGRSESRKPLLSGYKKELWHGYLRHLSPFSPRKT